MNAAGRFRRVGSENRETLASLDMVSLYIRLKKPGPAPGFCLLDDPFASSKSVKYLQETCIFYLCRFIKWVDTKC